MNWLIPENELDREQRSFLNEFINRSDNELIIGFPGSGKTMLLYYAALKIREKNPGAKIIFVEFTHALINMIEAALQQMHINDIKVVTQYEFEKAHKTKMKYDCIICDEVQDLSPKVLSNIANRAHRVIIGGDPNQQIYEVDPKWKKPTSSEADIQAILHPIVTRLNIVHRLSRFVMEAANDVMPEMKIIQEGRVSMTKKNIMIRLWKARNQQQEVSSIMKEAKESLRLTDSVAVLLPSHSKILSFADKALIDADKPTWKCTYDEHGNLDYNNLNDHLEANNIPIRYVGNGFGNFLETIPTITLMTYHGSKGLDFDKVFLPFCNHIDSETTQVDNDKKVFLVGMTRSRGDLIISFSKKLNHFVAKFAEGCTHKDLDSDNQPTLFASQDKLAVRTTKVKSCTMNELFGW